MYGSGPIHKRIYRGDPQLERRNGDIRIIGGICRSQPLRLARAAEVGDGLTDACHQRTHNSFKHFPGSETCLHHLNIVLTNRHTRSLYDFSI